MGKSIRDNSIYKHRIAKGVKVKDIADALHVRENTVYRWEEGVRVPSLKQRKELADLLGVDIRALYLPHVLVAVPFGVFNCSASADATRMDNGQQKESRT